MLFHPITPFHSIPLHVLRRWTDWCLGMIGETSCLFTVLLASLGTTGKLLHHSIFFFHLEAGLNRHSHIQPELWHAFQANLQPFQSIQFIIFWGSNKSTKGALCKKNFCKQLIHLQRFRHLRAYLYSSWIWLHFEPDVFGYFRICCCVKLTFLFLMCLVWLSNGTLLWRGKSFGNTEITYKPNQ